MEAVKKDKSHAELMLEKIEKAIDDYAVGGGQRTISLGGVSFQYASLADLLKLKAYYANEVRKEKGKHVYRVRLHLPC